MPPLPSMLDNVYVMPCGKSGADAHAVKVNKSRDKVQKSGRNCLYPPCFIALLLSSSSDKLEKESPFLVSS